MSGRGYFITGTDTGVGKTRVAVGLMQQLQSAGLRVCGCKPVAAGCLATAEGLRNEDAQLLRAQSSVRLDYSVHNPYAFAAPIAPHIAAQQAGIRPDLAVMQHAVATLAEQADVVVVEGAGGWLVPLNARETLADLARRLQFPVLLVVGIRLGCLNHALLSVEAIARRGLPLAGWVANCIDTDVAEQEANIASLQARIPAPNLGVIPWLTDPAGIMARYLTPPAVGRD